jgi:hypothetical protein
MPKKVSVRPERSKFGRIYVVSVGGEKKFFGNTKAEADRIANRLRMKKSVRSLVRRR